MSISFSVPCKHCGTPIIITVNSGTCGGVYGLCHHCSRGVNVQYSCNSNGKLTIFNVF